MNKILKQILVLMIISFAMVSCKPGSGDSSSSSDSSKNFSLEGESGGN